MKERYYFVSNNQIYENEKMLPRRIVYCLKCHIIIGQLCCPLSDFLISDNCAVSGWHFAPPPESPVLYKILKIYIFLPNCPYSDGPKSKSLGFGLISSQIVLIDRNHSTVILLEFIPDIGMSRL